VPTSDPACDVVALEQPTVITKSPSLSARIRARHAQERHYQIMKLAILVAVVAGFVSAVLYWWLGGSPGWLSAGGGKSPPPTGSALELPAYNLRVVLPENWVQDRGEAHENLRALLVLRRSRPQAWLAVLARDYRDRTPREDELREETLRRLQGYFTEHLQTESREEAELAGRPAQRLVFRGDVDQVVMAGECTTFAHQGIAYWLILWAPVHDAAVAQEEFDDLRRRFSLLGETRPDWKDRAKAQTFHGNQVGCTLTDEEGIWSEWTPATDHDPNADLALYVKEYTRTRGGDKLGRQVATALLLVLKPQPDLDAAVRAARVHLEDKQKELGLPTAIEPVADTGPSPEANNLVGKRKGRLDKLQVQVGETQRLFVVHGVIRQPERVLVLRCECDWRRRDDWEPRFLRLLDRLRFSEE
jgi:hypothetical protein